MRRPLSCDPECGRCGGSGVVVKTELAPGVSAMHVRCGGGPVPQVTRRELCSCVWAEDKEQSE